jgi:tetratricopeptide (TPR) repeat protein
MDLLTPRATGAGLSENLRIVGTSESAQVMPFVRAACDEFHRRREAGEVVASAILALGGTEWSDASIVRIAAIASQRASATFDTNEIAAFVYESAVESLKAGQISQAAVLLATLLHLGREEAEALSGLALCGVRMAKFEEALALASECLKLPVKHPRAYCIAGFCELERGNRKAAQSLLALGARIARGRPEFAEDLRAAQRVLLMLHFS